MLCLCVVFMSALLCVWNCNSGLSVPVCIYMALHVSVIWLGVFAVYLNQEARL
jgi:hypothetical protein